MLMSLSVPEVAMICERRERRVEKEDTSQRRGDLLLCPKLRRRGCSPLLDTCSNRSSSLLRLQLRTGTRWRVAESEGDEDRTA